MIPLLESLLPTSPQNHDPAIGDTRAKHKYFDWLLYLNVPIVYVLILYWLYALTYFAYTTWEIIGISLSVGVVLGANGINVAHELGHRVTAFERALAKLLLLPCLYMQFYIEHNRGHHFMALFPPLWFQVVNPLVPRAMAAQNCTIKEGTHV